jgi:hypothetical protein
VVVGAIVLAAAGLGAAFALRITSFEPDELGYTRLALGIAHSVTPFTLSYGGGQRLNQLYPLLIAPLWGSFGNVTAYRLTHVWNALLMSSAAIPAYLLAREVVRERWAGYLVAALVAVLPWLTLSTGELTEVAAYPASVWAALAMQRGLVGPGLRRDVIAMIAIAVAAYGRLQLILLAPAFVVAVVVHELGYALVEPGSRRENLVEGLRRMVRGHKLLSGATAIGIVVGIPLLATGKLASAAGFYGNTLSGVSLGGATFALARSYFVGIALGVGAIPAGLAIGFQRSPDPCRAGLTPTRRCWGWSWWRSCSRWRRSACGSPAPFCRSATSSTSRRCSWWACSRRCSRRAAPRGRWPGAA